MTQPTSTRLVTEASGAAAFVKPLGKTTTGAAAALPHFNVKDYGAVGDSTTDDTTAIQAAIDAAETLGGGTVFFPKGFYKVTSTVLLPSYVGLLGVNHGAQINSPTKIQWGGATGGTVIGPKYRSTDTKNCGIDGLWIAGMGTADLGIDMYRISYTHLYNTYVDGITSTGVGVQFDANDINQCYFNSARNCKVSGGLVGVRFKRGANVNTWEGGVVGNGGTAFEFLTLSTGNLISAVDMENNTVRSMNVDSPSNIIIGNHAESTPMGFLLTANAHDTRRFANTFATTVTTWTSDLTGADQLSLDYALVDVAELRVGGLQQRCKFVTSATTLDFDPLPFSGTSNILTQMFRNVTTSGTRTFTIYKGDGTNTASFIWDAKNNNLSLGVVGIGSGVGVVGIPNRTTAPSTTPALGGVLYAESGTLRWRTSSDTTRTIAGDVVTQSTTAVASVNGNTVLATGGASGITVQLPVAVKGSEFVIKKVDSGAGIVTVSTTSSQTIDGATTALLSTQYAYARVVSDGTSWFTTGVGPPPSGGAAAVIDVFTASGTWTKASGAKSVHVIAIGGGGAGGSGRRGAAGTVRCGGGGGGGGAVSEFTFAASLLGASEAVGVAVGGTGGVAAATDDTSGAAGTGSGTASTFGGHVSAGTGGAGQGGTLTTGTAGFNAAGRWASGNGGAASATGLAGTSGTLASVGGAPGGSSGGGVTSADAVSAGGTGLAAPGRPAGTATAGTAGGGVGGSGASAPSTQGQMGGGGAGGGSSITSAGGAGGAGGNYGAGGGGGGGSLNGSASGAGGAGGPGIVIVTTYF